jgi:hypothetical protein
MQAVGRSVSQLVDTVPPAPIPSIPLPSEADPTEDLPDLEGEEELRGVADLRAALRMVASGTATGVTICGFPDGHELLRLGRELAIEGIEVQPLIRRGGGGFDIRVHRVS